MTDETIRTLLQGLPFPALLIGQDERIIGANDGAGALLGRAIVGRHFITALRQPTVLDAVEACLRDRQKRETRYLSNDGAQDTTFDVSVAHVTLGGAGHGGALVCFADVTHLEQASQMRRDFVANVSHELRTPLTALLGFIETLRGPAREDAAARDRFLATMMVEATRMERLVRDLLSLSRVESQERVRPTERIDLNDLLGSVRDALAPVARDADVTLVLDLPDGILPVPADADQLRQVFTNLIENAIKYGGSGKSVHVCARSSGHEPGLRGPAAIVTVRDEGPGIEEVHIPRLTERFYRVDPHRSREMGGTGLGLAIVKHIINRHRGRFRIASSLGKGSEFKVILPMGPQT